MPRDGSASRARIMASAKEEFLEKGFEGASIRAIAKSAGVTSAALYRHFPSKEEIFSALVEPAIGELESWMSQHVSDAYAGARSHELEWVSSRSSADMIREVAFPNKESFKLLLCCAQGTRYQNFVHDLVERQQIELSRGLVWLRNHGYDAAETSDETLHMMLSAFLTALFEPIVHDYPQENAEQYIQTIERLFLPGWRDMLGI